MLRNLDEASGQDRLVGTQLAQASVEHASDLRRMLGDVHVVTV
jgi:hypothetical protein